MILKSSVKDARMYLQNPAVSIHIKRILDYGRIIGEIRGYGRKKDQESKS